MRMLKKLLNRFLPKKKTDKSAEMTMMLLQMLALTREDELSCDEVHELVDKYIELKQRGENVDELMPLVQLHLDMCGGCLDEYEAVMVALEFEEAR